MKGYDLHSLISNLRVHLIVLKGYVVLPSYFTYQSYKGYSPHFSDLMVYIFDKYGNFYSMYNRKSSVVAKKQYDGSLLKSYGT